MPQLKEQLQKAIHKMNNFEQLKKQIEITVTAEGLRIELLESAAGTFFDSGSTHLNDSGKELLVMLAQELQKLPNTISIEGHTDSKPFVGAGNYSNWELSSDRANAARRLMQENGVRHDQVSQVRGFADQNLRKKDDPEDPSNRRITILVQYLPKPEPEVEPAKPGTAQPGEAEHPK
jgi:chemotaxis protein MotB